MKIKNLLITRHGSHLYGMATPTSDIDLYVIYDFYHQNYRPKRLIQQSIDDESDTTKTYVENFIGQVQKGVPQALEALFSPPEAWLERHYDWHEVSWAMIWDIPKFMPDILDTYKRTAINFMAEDNFKKNRHALRLLHNALELKETAKINPRLDTDLIEKITKEACLPFDYRLEKFKQKVYDIFG